MIHQILVDDQQAPKKQRHTARRIFERLRDEHGYPGGATVVKDAVRDWKQSHQEVFVPLVHPPGEAQVDFGEATIQLAGVETKVALLVLTLAGRTWRSCASQRPTSLPTRRCWRR